MELTGARPVHHEEDGVQTLSTGSLEAGAVPLQGGTLTDEEIVVRICAGETQSFEILMRRYNQRLYRAVRAILQSDADAEDAVQQAYLNAYRCLGQFEGRARFSTWLIRIAVNEALARRRRAHDKPLESSDDEESRRTASAAPDPERQAYAGELSALLQSALAALPHGYRSVFTLREVDGLNTAETAQRLCVSEGVVKTRLHRARDLLRRKLDHVTPADALGFDGPRCDRIVAAVMSRLPDAQFGDTDRIGQVVAYPEHDRASSWASGRAMPYPNRPVAPSRTTGAHGRRAESRETPR
jgi:RNA polymerase sigma-70 factor (ECF subfamily)